MQKSMLIFLITPLATMAPSIRAERLAEQILKRWLDPHKGTMNPIYAPKEGVPNSESKLDRIIDYMSWKLPFGSEKNSDSANADSKTKIATIPSTSSTKTSAFDTTLPGRPPGRKGFGGMLDWIASNVKSKEGSKSEESKSNETTAAVPPLKHHKVMSSPDKVAKSRTGRPADLPDADDPPRPSQLDDLLLKFPEHQSSLPIESLTKLECLPQISFKSCLEHCVNVAPSHESSTAQEAKGFDFRGSLPPPSSRSWFFSPRGVSSGLLYAPPQKKQESSEEEERTNGHARKESLKGSSSSAGATKRSTILDPEEWRDFQMCVLSICVPDYITTPVTGCLDSGGRVVTGTPKSENREPLDYYNPTRVNFYSGIGYFTIARIWRNLFPESGRSGIFGGFSSLFNFSVFVITSSAVIILPTLLVHWVWPHLRKIFRGESEEYPKLSAQACVMPASWNAIKRVIDNVNTTYDSVTNALNRFDPIPSGGGEIEIGSHD